MLSADGIGKRFGGATVLNGVSMEVGQTEIVGLVGPNGSGKTTLLNCMTGFLRPDSGTVCLDAGRLDRLPAYRVGRLGVRRTFQLPSQPVGMSVTETMLCGAALTEGARLRGLLRARRCRAEERAALDRARELLCVLNLSHVAEERAGRLSGGQQKLISIAVALMDRPRVLILDEPTAGVHPTLRQTLVARLRELPGQGTAVLVVEHDMTFIGQLCDRVYVLDRGEVISCCRPSELKHDRRVVEAYLGPARDTAASDPVRE